MEEPSPRQQRISYRRPICLVREGSSEPLRGLASDLSPGGMFVRGDWSLEVGTVVEVKLETQWRDLPLATAKVAWQTGSDHPKGAGVGLQFVDFAASRTHEMLHRLLDPFPPGTEEEPGPLPLPPPRPRRLRPGLLWLGAAALAALAVLAVLWLLGRSA